MAQPNDPLKPVAEAVAKIHKSLSQMLKKLWQSLKAMLRPLTNILKAIVNGAKQLASTIGKATVDGIIKVGQKIAGLVDALLGDLKGLVQALAKLLALLVKIADPAAAVAKLKTILKKIAQMMNKLLARVVSFIAELNVIGPLLKVVETFRAVLQFIFSWVAQVGGLLSLIKTARSLLKKAMTALKAHVKECVDVIRKVAEIKAA